MDGDDPPPHSTTLQDLSIISVMLLAYPQDSITSLLLPQIMESIPQVLTKIIDWVHHLDRVANSQEDYLSTTPTLKSSLSVVVIVTL